MLQPPLLVLVSQWLVLEPGRPGPVLLVLEPWVLVPVLGLELPLLGLEPGRLVPERQV